MKKVVSMLLVLTVICGSLVFATVTANAANTADSLVSVAEGELGNTNYSKYSSYANAWCADFVSWCARQVGVDSIPSTASCYSMYNGMNNNGCQVVSSPQKGDIVFFYCNSCSGTSNVWCHVGIMVDSSTSIDGNYSGKVSYDRSYSHYGSLGYKHSSGISKIYVRPNYNYEPTPVNLGDNFYAFIINTEMWKHLTVEQDNNVDIRGEKSHYCADQMWEFERQGDNSYKIISTANGECLDVHNASGENYANVKTCNDNGSDAQRWFIYPNNNGFYLKAKCTNCVLDITGGYSDDGTNVQMYAKNDTYAQKFTVYQINETRPFAANLGNDFTAPLLNLKSWITLENCDNGDLALQKETGKSNQLWRFIRQIDGSYKIYSCFDGKCIDLDNAAYENGTNIKMWKSNENDAQRWFLYEYNGGYSIQSKLSGKFFDVTSGSLNFGTSIQAWEWNGSDAQKFAVYRGDECKLGAVKLSVAPNNGSADFIWSTTYGETAYVLKLWQGKALEGDPYLVQKSIPSRTNSLSIYLPKGYYEGYILSQNYYESFTSNTVSFTVEKPQITLTNFLGDANGDEDVDSVDATIIQRVCTMLKVPYSEEQLMCADVDADGSLSTVDATFIQRYSTYISTPYKIGDPI